MTLLLLFSDSSASIALECSTLHTISFATPAFATSTTFSNVHRGLEGHRNRQRARPFMVHSTRTNWNCFSGVSSVDTPSIIRLSLWRTLDSLKNATQVIFSGILDYGPDQCSGHNNNFGPFSNGWDVSSQMPFEYWTIQHCNYFQPFDYQKFLVF